MASSNVPDDVASICSVCLEPYKGRNPKLLPCFHTLCLPCLKDLEKHHMEMTRDTTVGEDIEETKPLTFPCPTCRAVIKVPTGGVTQFQTNFYINKNSVTCDICERGEDAVCTCTECGDNMCVTCQRYHSKLASNHQVQPLTFNCQQASKTSIEPVKEGTITEQLKVMEAAMVTLSEEEDTLQRERQAVADVISRRADAVRALVTQAEERSQRALVEVAEILGKQIQEKIITARDRCCRIWQLSSQLGTKGELTSVPSHGQTSLLTDDDVQMYKQQCSRGRQLQTLLHQFDDSAINMQVIEAYIGTVSSGTQCTGENSSSLLSAVTCSETRPLERQESDTPLTSLPSDMTKLSRDIADIKDKLAALKTATSSLEKQQTAVLELEALKEENSNLQSQVVSLREADSKMQENMDTFQQNVEKNRGDILNLQKDITNTDHEFQAMKAIILQLQNDVDSSQKESLLIKTETKKLQDAAEELSKGFKTFKASNLVAFNARLHKDSPAGRVILREVDCNVGQAYDNTTGIFTVPVTGIYFFMARAMAAMEPSNFYLRIMVDDLSAAMSGLFGGKPYHGMNYTVHLVQRLIKGQKCYRNSGVRAFYRGDRLVVGGPLYQNTNRQQEERENPRTNADRSPSQHQEALQQQTDEYTLVTVQRNNGVRQHRSSQSYLPLPLRNCYLPLQTDEEEDNTILRADKHGEQIDTNEATRRGSIINNLQMIPTAVLPTKCPAESNTTKTSTGDNTKEKDTPPYTSATEANNSQTADVSECPPDSNVQVSSPHPASVSPSSRDPETTHGVPVQTSRVETRSTTPDMLKRSKGHNCR